MRISQSATANLPYQHCCVDLSWKIPGQVEALLEFMEHARQVTRRTFVRHADSSNRLDLERQLGYVVGSAKGLHCKDDYHVAYYQGTYRGTKAVCMKHSAIEYMFFDPDKATTA